MIGLSGAFTAGASGTLVNDVITNTTTPAGPDARPFTCEGMLVNNVASLAAAMMEGVLYVNVHTSTNGGGEVRGQFFGH